MVQAKLTKGVIFDIQGFSVHDGPGCRTLIFFKGCPLECAWCSNPEGISFFPEPLYNHSKCTFDRLCTEACPYKAISVSQNEETDHLVFDRVICSKCSSFECAKACCSGALKIGGYEIGVEDLFSRISRDRPYWGERGGITLTGGEPFAQPDFSTHLLKRCFEAYIHTAVETCGNVPWENYKNALPYLDWIFYDLKILNEDYLYPPAAASAPKPTYPPDHLSTCPPAHLSTYQPAHLSTADLILENARRISAQFNGRLIFRLPVVPGYNSDQANIERTARFILSTGRNEINILPLHHLGREKYKLLDKKYMAAGSRSPSKEELQEIASQFESLGITCYTGSETPF